MISGVTLAAYEVLSTFFPVPGSESALAQKAGRLESAAGLKDEKTPLPFLRSRNALKLILDIDSNFGRIRVPEGKSFMGLPFGRPSSS